jgi:NADH:ubiquinone oxidoreductase subunit K
MSRDGLALLQLVIMMLWCIALLIGSLLFGFMGLAFASEPGSGSAVSGMEYLVAAAPLFIALGLMIGLLMLWLKQYYKTALAIWLLSVI